MNATKLVLLLVLCALAVSAQECVPGYSYANPFEGANVTSYISGGWTLLRGYTTPHHGWLESMPNEGPCYFYSSGLPPGITVRINGQNYTEPRLQMYHCYGTHNVLLDVPKDAPIGEYTWKFTISRNNEVNVTNCNHMRVMDVPELARSPVDKSNLEVPYLDTWEYNMVERGNYFCLSGECCWEGFSWYYDGVKVFHQIRDYTGNDSFLPCIEHHRYYFPYVLDNKGAIPGWRVFPHGLYYEYLRTGDESYRDGVFFLGNSSASAGDGGGGSGVGSRETAYLIHTYNVMSKLGYVSPMREKAIMFALGHYDQWFVSFQPQLVQSFMIGLTCDALIEYWEETQDARIPWMVKLGVDGVWDMFYNETERTFNYNTDLMEANNDLNLLTAHCFTWLWAYTGDNTYRDRGDILWEASVRYAWLGGGKQFSQNYRSSFKFVKWRQNPDLISEVAGPITVGTPSGSGPSGSGPSSSSPSSPKPAMSNAIASSVAAVSLLLPIVLLA